MGRSRRYPLVGESVKISKSRRHQGTIVSVDTSNAAAFVYSIKFETLHHYEILKAYTRALKRSTSQNYEWTVTEESLINQMKTPKEVAGVQFEIVEVRTCDRIGCKAEGSIKERTVLSEDNVVYNHVCLKHTNKQLKMKKVKE